MKIERALLSVSNKEGLVEFAQGLSELGIEIYSTGGTEAALKAAGVPVEPVSALTNFPEILSGRVKTLHPKVLGGILARRGDEEHAKELAQQEIVPIDLVVVNLYPFAETIAQAGVTMAEAIEQIDIGGPTMVRAAAKNWQGVGIVTDPQRYPEVLAQIKGSGGLTDELRLELAQAAFAHTARYDSLIATYLGGQIQDGFPQDLFLNYSKVSDLRYGENPHQKAAFYEEAKAEPYALSQAEQLHGKELSFNNINDANGAIELLLEYDEPTAVAVKHTNPCGVATASDLYSAYIKAYEADPVSIFGGIVALNRTVDQKTAQELAKIFLEIVIAPDFSQEALAVLTQKKNLRILRLPALAAREQVAGFDLKKVRGGVLLQERDAFELDPEQLEVVTKRKPTEEELAQLLFAWKAVKHTKSNAIVLARDFATTGVGAGQMNRIDAAKIAINAAKEKAEGSVLASDAFFPFSDVVEVAGKAGIGAIIQPGGSIRDQESIELADQLGLAMVFTKVRHFKH